LNGLSSDAAARCTARFSRMTAKCARYVDDNHVRNLTNPAHFKGDVVTLRCKCNAANKAFTRCVHKVEGRNKSGHKVLSRTSSVCFTVHMYIVRNNSEDPNTIVQSQIPR
jgi:hypothetical protein